MNRKGVMVGVLVLFMGLGWNGRGVCAEEAEHGGAHHAGGHDEAGEALKPETLQGIWHEVMEAREQLDETISTGKLDEVHKVAFHIRDLVQMLPKVSGELPPDKQQRLRESIHRVADVAGLLDQYGDAGDAVNTKTQADRLAKLLRYIETLYPEGTLHDAHQPGSGRPAPQHP